MEVKVHLWGVEIFIFCAFLDNLRLIEWGVGGKSLLQENIFQTIDPLPISKNIYFWLWKKRKYGENRKTLISGSSSP